MVKPSSSSSYCGKKKGAWTKEEDNKLRNYVQRYGHWNWRLLPKFAGLERCGKSCRLRWMNYLKPGLKKGNFTKQEKDLLIKLHKQLGNKWSTIAAKFPGRTDNDIKNFWHAHIQKHSKRISEKSAKLSKEHTDHQSSTNESSCMENQELSTHEDGTTHDNGNYHSNLTADNQISFWSEPFCCEDYCLSPLPEVNYSELLSFDSTSFSTTLDWSITDDQDHSLLISSNQSAALLMQEDFWDEPFMTDAFQGENSHLPGGGFHDPSSLYFDQELK